MVNSERRLWKYILFSLLTCGIYSWFFFYEWARDVNQICDGDGEDTPGLLPFVLLTLVTCGIYSYYWYYKLGNRLQRNGPRYGLDTQDSGSTILMWMLIGALLCGIGIFVGLHILIDNTNRLAAAYNAYVSGRGGYGGGYGQPGGYGQNYGGYGQNYGPGYGQPGGYGQNYGPGYGPGGNPNGWNGR